MLQNNLVGEGYRRCNHELYGCLSAPMRAWMLHVMSSPPLRISRDAARAYLIDMIQQLAKLARTVGEVEVEILLRAILDIARATAQRRAG